jgi:uncharacterized protein
MDAIPIDEEGRFSGYASVFGLPDDGGDIVMPGAFAKSLAQRGRARIRMLFQHDPKEPIGIWEALEEDRFGLRVEGRLVPGVPRAEALKALIGRGAVDGLSIGFRTVKATREKTGRHRRLLQIDLWEISIVSFPMMDKARIAAASAEAAQMARSLRSALSILK